MINNYNAHITFNKCITYYLQDQCEIDILLTFSYYIDGYFKLHSWKIFDLDEKQLTLDDLHQCRLLVENWLLDEELTAGSSYEEELYNLMETITPIGHT